MRPSRFPLALVVVCALAVVASPAATPARTLGAPTKVFILAGDETMIGRAQPVSAGETPDPGLLMWRNRSWVEATDPLGTRRTDGVGPGMSFGLKVLADNPGSTVGLIMCAAADSRINDWAGNAKSCAKTAQAAGGQVAGVVFLQGRTDAKKEKLAQTWGTQFANALASFRSKLGADMPYVVGQLGDLNSTYPYAGMVRDQQASAVSSHPGAVLVSTLDLPLDANGVYFTVDANKTLGARLADAWEQLSATWHPPDEVFVMAGQSNMVGRGLPVSAGTLNDQPDLLNQRDGVWQIASDPLGPPSNKESGVGPGMTFADRVLEYQPGKTIGIVMCAVGGTDSVEWLPGGKLYKACISGARAAGAPVAGILYLQGESEANDFSEANGWKGHFEQTLAAFRADLGADVPFVLGQIGAIEASGDYPYAQIVRDAQAQAAAENPGVALVVTDDLALGADDLHFTVDSYKTIGQRMGDAWWSLTGP